MSRTDRQRWDERYEEEKWKGAREPYPLLTRHVPPGAGGLALDVACGLGHNLLWLAGQGYRGIGVDVSRVALEQALGQARAAGLADRVLFVQADLDRFRLPPGSFDLVVVIRFLDRELFPALEAALRPGGLLVYATLNWRRAETHPEVAPEYLMGPGELHEAFTGLRVTHYDEAGDHSELVARKPA